LFVPFHGQRHGQRAACVVSSSVLLPLGSSTRQVKANQSEAHQ